MADRAPVKIRLAKALWDAGGPISGMNDEETKVFYERLAEASRSFLGGLVGDFAAALEDSCIRHQHRGAVPPRDGRKGMACLRCKSKIKNIREAAELIEPDRH